MLQREITNNFEALPSLDGKVLQLPSALYLTPITSYLALCKFFRWPLSI